MTQHTPEVPAPENASQLVLTDDAGLGRIAIDMQAFFEFSFWMAEELEDLIQKHRPARTRRQRLEVER